MSGNDLSIAVVETSENLSGVTFASVQPTGGLVDPDIQPAIDQIGTVWETLVLNCYNDDNVDALNALQTAGEGRWGPLIRKPFVAFLGNTDVDVNDAIALPDTRKTDRINAQLVAPGSKELPLVVAARQLARIAVIANNNPARDYGSLEATGIEGGADADQWTYPERDQAVKGGSSTTEVKDGVVTLGDIVTYYHPTGDPIPAYRYVVDIVKVMNIIFNLDLIFVSPEWDGAPLIPDGQPTNNRDARQPKAAVAAVAAMVDNLALGAILSNPEEIKATIQAAINDQNPKRLDIKATYQISGNVNIISKVLSWGFFFGVTPLVAQ